MSHSLEQIPVPLLTWFEEHKRTLPWREEPSAYHVWVSEIMLQQTRVAAVIGYYERFLQAFPTISALADAELERVLKLWQGLGYYSRARNLHRAAIVLRDTYGAQFPTDYAAVRALPGIGDYTAAAICSICYGLPVPVIDGNVLRVVSRITADARDVLKQETKKSMAAALRAIMPVQAAGTFNQAMMELGALVCLPNGAPQCEVCPVAFYCQARAQGITAQLPVKTPKKARKVEQRTVYLLFYQNCVAIRKRPPRGLLAGLYEFPNELEAPVWEISGSWQRANVRAKHIFSHIEWQMDVQCLHTQEADLPDGWQWATWEEICRAYPIPNAFSAVMPLVEEEIGRNLTWQSFITDME